MKKYSRYGKLLGILLVGSLFCSACTGSSGKERKQAPKTQIQTDLPEENLTEKPKNESKDQASTSNSEIQDTGMEPAADASAEPAADSESENLQKEQPKEKVVETDWSEYFDGLHGAAVVYDTADRQYRIYNRKTAAVRRSPCSTFKIISSLAALENGILEPEDSTRTWSGEVFWNEDWNRDIDFYEAFRVSCVWYFRQLTDEVGQEKMQETLDRLKYGNRDLSDWEGRLNTNNNNRALTGFWIESSLAISPKEQVKVMKRIFSDPSVYSKNTQDALKQAMRLHGQTDEDDYPYPIYGKTGMGVAHGATVDAWYTGFMERPEGNVYFCVWLGQTDGREVSSAIAREIAVRILSQESADHSFAVR